MQELVFQYKNWKGEIGMRRVKPILNETYVEMAKKQIREALEKQTPKAIEFDENDLNICPICKNHVMTDDKYCKNCGQRIFINCK